MNILAFMVYPYLVLTTFVVGHGYRYSRGEGLWNAKSSEFLDKPGLFWGIVLFHWGILFTLAGHAGGLLIPQVLLDRVGIDGQVHTEIAYYSGMLVGAAACIGAILLLMRRAFRQRIRRTTSINDGITLAALSLVSGTGMYNVLFGHFYVLDTIAPWIRGIILLTPDPNLMEHVPVSYKIHILGALTLLGYSPFSRLVHIWSVPITYIFRRYLIYRRRMSGENTSEA